MSASIPTARGTAIVTGASSGIGKTYARQLARRGYNLILIARRQDLLTQIARDLQAEFSVEATVLSADLSKPDGISAVTEHIAQCETLSMIVNNAGVSALKPLADTPDDAITAMIHLNVLALTALSKAALMKFKEQGRGTIINVGSGAGFLPFPAIPLYTATKAFVHLFTQNLQGEVAGTEIRVQLVVPGAVKSEGWDRAIESGFNGVPDDVVMSTQNCVDASLAGLDQGEAITAPSLEDTSILQDYEAVSMKLVQSMFNGIPATRYNVGGSA